MRLLKVVSRLILDSGAGRVLRVPTCTDCCAILAASAQRQVSRMTSVDIYPVAQPNAVQRLGGSNRPIGQQFRASMTVQRWKIPACGRLWYHI
jgi:hypothetical protein